jgi:hypothetical protein
MFSKSGISFYRASHRRAIKNTTMKLPTIRKRGATMPTTVNTRGSKKRQRKEEGKGEENDEEERETAPTVSESESSPHAKGKEANEEDKRGEHLLSEGGKEAHDKTPMKEEGMAIRPTQQMISPDGMNIQLDPDMDPRLREMIENTYSEITRVVNRMDQHTARTLEHLDMVKKTTEERNQAAKETLIGVFYTTFIKWVDDANESVTLDQKIATIKDMVANLRSSIGA